MKQLKRPHIITSLLVVTAIGHANAALMVSVDGQKTYGQKTILRMDLQNTFTNAIESARAAVFLLDEKGTVVGQETRWMLGGTKDRPALAPEAKTTFNFVIQATKPFAKTKVVVTRLVLQGGQVVDVNKEVQITQAPN